MVQALALALIGAIGLAIPALIANGSVRRRRLGAMRDELDLLKALPDDRVLDRQLMEYALRESLWDYATSRSRPGRVWRLAAGLFSIPLMLVGYALVEGGNWAEAFKPQHGWRGTGIVLLAVGALLYLGALAKSFDVYRPQIAALDGPRSRHRQLVAAEILRMESDPRQIHRGEPKNQNTFDKWIDKFLGTWTEFDKRDPASDGSSGDEP